MVLAHELGGNNQFFEGLSSEAVTFFGALSLFGGTILV